MPAAPLIAVVEDEEHLAQGLIFNLEAEGYRVHHEVDGDAALAWLLSAPEAPSAVLLDVMLPGQDGFAIVRAMRQAGQYTPVLMLTARGRSEDVVEGFEAGADDYLPKPFDLSILLARLAALLRRLHWQKAPAPSAVDAPSQVVETEVARRQSYSFDGRTIDLEELTIHAPDRLVHLTVMEADLLRYLLERPGRIVARKEILEKVWHVHEDTDTRAIDNFIVRLRRYLEPDPSNPVHLLSVRGVGYRFVPEPSAAVIALAE
jgi:DNA-binding response OmpR family regulator